VDAARRNQLVEIHRYAQIALAAPAASPEATIRLPVSLIEVHSDGLKVLVETCNYGLNDTPKEDINDDVWTLAQLARREAIDQQQKDSSSTGSKQQRFTCAARVHAVSPVIAMDPSDPFLLMELYDPDSTFTCVVVLCKAGLQCHAALVSQDYIVLQSVQRQKWRIPDVLAKKQLPQLQGRIPSHVFVVDQAHQIVFQSASSKVQQNHPSQQLSFTRQFSCSLQGTIVSVHMINAGDQTYIHYLEVAVATEHQQHHLYLTYFPMSSSLQVGLRKGAVIQATNLHRVMSIKGPSIATQGSSYGACLRSCVVVIKTASEVFFDAAQGHSSNHSSVSNGQVDASPLDCTLSLGHMVPFAFLRIRRSYAEYACRQMLTTWMEDFIVTDSLETAKLPSLEELSLALLGNQSQKSTARNAYAEFFDHGIDFTDLFDKVQEIQDCACHLSFRDRFGAGMPRLLCLGDIRDKTFHVLETRLRAYLLSSSAHNMRVGWTASITISAGNFGSRQGETTDERRSKTPVYIGGMTGGTVNQASLQVKLSNGNVILPAVCAVGATTSFSTPIHFAFAKLESVSVSCICIRISSDETGHNRSDYRTKKLPPFQFGTHPPKEMVGPCSIIEVDGLLFIASVSLNCNHFLPVTSKKATKACPISKETGTERVTSCSIQSCMDPNGPPSDAAICIVGLMTRKFFKLAKAKNGDYTGCTLTISHETFDRETTPSSESVSCIQAIEVKPWIAIDSVGQLRLRRCLSSVLDLNLTQDQLALALVWWKIACDERMCALLGGGWDELASEESTAARSIGVMVRIPRSAVLYEPKRGYTRFRCRFDDLSASLQFFSRESRFKATYRSQPLLDFVCSGRMLPGVLDGRPQRRMHGDATAKVTLQRGELFLPPRNAGIPHFSLLELSWAICSDLKNNSRKMLAPSLVREIRGATLLGITYCRAQATCTKCYKTLYQVKTTQDNDNPTTAAQSGIVASVPLAESMPSFWDHPLPIPIFKSNHLLPDKPPPPPKAAATRPHATRHHQRTTTLRCPEQCSVPQYASIKWECSGTLDDGTGQAKLYAERDVALALLGMDVQTVQAIEAGAWLDGQGIVFSKAFPPKPVLREAVVTAKTMALQRNNTGRGLSSHQREMTEWDVLQFLTPLTRAEYLMQRFCRNESSESTRALTYYARCKPLFMDATLGQTQVEIAAAGPRGSALTRDVATYSLPPLKLNLVDCSVVDTD
jgi:hypothetical protein